MATSGWRDELRFKTPRAGSYKELTDPSLHASCSRSSYRRRNLNLTGPACDKGRRRRTLDAAVAAAGANCDDHQARNRD